VGRYGVDVSAIDNAVEAIWTPGRLPPLYIIDEIGKMECFSTKFVQMMRALFRSNKALVATVAARGGGLIAEAKRLRGAKLLEVTRDSREGLVERVKLWIEAAPER
jgi:nucleoside-triphosphatase